MIAEHPFFDRFYAKLCKLFGHRWRYKDYSNYMKLNGDKYDYSASRHCGCCGQDAYFYSAWQNEMKSDLDYASDYFSSATIKINNIVYS